MGNKKQAQAMSDRELMQRAIELSRKCKSEPGKVSPLVGAVVARDGIVLGEAYRGEFADGEHAEYTLLERKLADATLAGAVLYTTLEPCTARNDPKIPCVERVIERRIAKVFIGILDPNQMIRGRGELSLRDAGIQIARFDPDLMPIIEELNRSFSREQRANPLQQRTAAETTDPVEAGARGPNGYKIGYTPEGDKVEWIPDDESPGELIPMVLRRNDNSILEAYREYWDKVWWNRHMVWANRVERGEETLDADRRKLYERAHAAAQRIESEYGLNELECTDFEFGLMSGKLSALAWVMGAEWNESLDT
jgi:pyrimidine deaminase RibD-like protein